MEETKTQKHNKRRRATYEKRPEFFDENGLNTTQIAEELGCSRINVCHLTKTALYKVAEELLLQLDGKAAARDHNRVMTIIKEPHFIDLIGEVLREKPHFSSRTLKQMAGDKS